MQTDLHQRADRPLLDISSADLSMWQQCFFDDAASEYDARFLLPKILPLATEADNAFCKYLDSWAADETTHYEGFADLYASFAIGDEGPTESRIFIDTEMAKRTASFAHIEPFLRDEFSVCVLLAYDELMNAQAYRGDFVLYDRLHSTLVSQWIRRVARDEARHYAGSLSLLKFHHQHRLHEVESLLEMIVETDNDKVPYEATFVLDRSSDVQNTARGKEEACAEIVLRHLHRAA